MEDYLDNFEKSRLVVYTVIIGGYDSLKSPEFIDENCDYICFTNNSALTSDIWQIRIIENKELDNTRCQRMYKILPHRFLPDYEYSIYIDGNVRIIGSLRDFVRQQWKGAPLLGLRHSSRDNIYDEAEACINFKKDDPEIIRKQIERYKSEGYPADNGLIASGILFRKHTDEKLGEVMEDWWKEIRDNSKRDQLSFSYVCWKHHFIYDVSELKIYRSDYWLNPGIHTDNIRDIENELIDHIQLANYQQHLIDQKDQSIVLKEREKEEAIAIKEREKEEAIAAKEREKEEVIAAKEREKEKAIAAKEREKEKAIAEKEVALVLKEQELEKIIALKEEEQGRINFELNVKCREVSDLIAQINHMENTLSWRYTSIFRKIFVKRK